jgi:AcrR family transcriptional regulator
MTARTARVGNDGRMTRRPVAERRTQLAEAAIRIATRDGLATTTTRRVAAEAEVSLGSVHYCFESKEALLIEMTRVLVSESAAAAAAAIGTPSPPARDVTAMVRRALAAYWSSVEADPERHLLTYELAAWGLRAGTGVGQEQRRAQLLGAAEVIELLGREAGIRWRIEVSRLASLVVAVTDGVTLGWLVDRDDAAAGAALDAFAEQLAAYAEPRVSGGG